MKINIIKNSYSYRVTIELYSINFLLRKTTTRYLIKFYKSLLNPYIRDDIIKEKQKKNSKRFKRQRVYKNICCWEENAFNKLKNKGCLKFNLKLDDACT